METLQFRHDWNQKLLRARYETEKNAIASVSSPSELVAAFHAWENVRRDAYSWKAITDIRLWSMR